jgi:hypothetical protein
LRRERAVDPEGPHRGRPKPTGMSIERVVERPRALRPAGGQRLRRRAAPGGQRRRHVPGVAPAGGPHRPGRQGSQRRRRR